MRTHLGKVLKRCLCLVVTGIFILGYGLLTASSAETAINGSLRQIGSQQVLRLWGSHYEMGYAHGYLMADKIRDIVDSYVVGYLATGNTVAEKAADYKSRLPLIPLHHTFYSESQDEINGMVAGMAASGKSLFVPSLNRNIDERDIKAFNLFVELYFGCSSFGVWGDATANGETIIARNYDFFVDPQGNILKDQILITYEPTGKPKFVSFAWPGWIGVVTGMNEYGITVMVNAGSGDNSNSSDLFHPSIEVFRNILENSTTDNYDFQPLSIVNTVSEYTPLSIQVGSPYKASGDSVYYIEDSSSPGNSSGPNLVRNAAYTDPTYDHIIATNHFLKITPPPTSGDTVIRYNTLRNGLISLYGTGDHTVDSQEAWTLLGKVADIVAPTLTSIVARPNRMEFDVSFAAMVNGVYKSAVNIQPQTYTWATLFPPPTVTVLPDLVISAISVPASTNACQSISITDTTSNNGSAVAGASVTKYYRSADAVYDATDILIGSREIPQLAVGASSSGSTSVAVPCDTTPGTYFVIARTDAYTVVAENNETNNIRYVTMTVADTTAPTVAITSPAANATIGGTVTFTASASDNVRVSKVEFYVNGSLKGSDTTTPYSFSWNSKSVANGSYSITARAYDAAGNVTQSAAVVVTVKNGVVDTIAPAVSITSPVANSTIKGTVCAVVSVSDNVGVTKVEYYVSGRLDKTVTVSPFGYCVATTAAYNGSYSMYAKAYDAAGNVKQSSSVNYTIRN